jgi:hypothetical protein
VGEYAKKQYYEEAKAEVYPARSGSGQFRDRKISNSSNRFDNIGPSHENRSYGDRSQNDSNKNLSNSYLVNEPVRNSRSISPLPHEKATHESAN